MDESRRANRRKSYFKGPEAGSSPFLSFVLLTRLPPWHIALSNSKMAFCSWEPTYYSFSSSGEEKRASFQLASGLTLTGVAWAFCLLRLILSSSRYRQPWATCPSLESGRCIHQTFTDYIHSRTFIKEHWQMKIHQDQNKQTKKQNSLASVNLQMRRIYPGRCKSVNAGEQNEQRKGVWGMGRGQQLLH